MGHCWGSRTFPISFFTDTVFLLPRPLSALFDGVDRLLNDSPDEFKEDSDNGWVCWLWGVECKEWVLSLLYLYDELNITPLAYYSPNLLNMYWYSLSLIGVLLFILAIQKFIQTKTSFSLFNLYNHLSLPIFWILTITITYLLSCWECKVFQFVYRIRYFNKICIK